MKLQSFKELIAWQKAMDMAVAVYRATQGFPREELYGLTIQMRRSATSVPSNIAEGQGRASTGEFKHFLGNAYGSLCELETQVDLAARLGYLSEERRESLSALTAEVGRIINGLNASLKS
jgi:four helix bundle protein